MAAMNAPGEIISPASGAVVRYYAAKFRVFHRLHADFMVYRQLMRATWVYFAGCSCAPRTALGIISVTPTAASRRDSRR